MASPLEMEMGSVEVTQVVALFGVPLPVVELPEARPQLLAQVFCRSHWLCWSFHHFPDLETWIDLFLHSSFFLCCAAPCRGCVALDSASLCCAGRGCASDCGCVCHGYAADSGCAAASDSSDGLSGCGGAVATCHQTEPARATSEIYMEQWCNPRQLKSFRMQKYVEVLNQVSILCLNMSSNCLGNLHVHLQIMQYLNIHSSNLSDQM